MPNSNATTIARPVVGQQVQQAARQFWPVVASFRINAGAAITGSRVVVLDITLGANAARVTEMRVSESPQFIGSSWQPFQSRPSANLSIGNGEKTIYFQVRAPAARPTAVNGGFDSSVIVSDSIVFANPRLIGVSLADGRNFTQTENVSIKVDYEGNANRYRVAENPEFAGIDVGWRELGGTRVFPYRIRTGPSDKIALYVQIANGDDYVSDVFRLPVNYVRPAIFEPNIADLFNEARAEGYVFRAVSSSGQWICSIEFVGNTYVELRATPRANVAGHGWAGDDTCTFTLFGGKRLAAPWLIQRTVTTTSTVGDANIQVIDAPDASGGNDLGTTVRWTLGETTPIVGSLYHRGIIFAPTLSGPENGDWRDAFE
ncbi:MAG: hypothetical protein R3E77_13530 [Steroidobacteraceae bacterium]